MAVVMLAVNGAGLGHLIRSAIVSQALAAVGEHPVIFSEGRYQPRGSAQFPVRVIPSLWGSPDDIRKRVAAELRSMATISLPAVVVEDTHPNPIELPAEIRRVLLVRPTSFEYLVRLNERHGAIYSAYLLCDSPDSPTWPYDEPQTRQLASWKKWHVIGPIYRTTNEHDLRDVRARHHLSEDQEVCVFTMGGGGVNVRDPNGQDIIRFLRLALETADVIQAASPRVRLLFVKGPYFPARVPIPPRFEILQDVEQMPALLKIAKGAVIRAGFNTTWECVAAGTPFIPLIGTTFAEPVGERVDRLAALGLIPPSIERFWTDDAWRAEYRHITANIVARHSGAPNPTELARLIIDRGPPSPIPKRKVGTIRLNSAKQKIPFVIRIDDVVSKEPALCWLLDVLAGQGLRASLEVVPYLMEFDQTFLDRFDPSRALFEVSQHGYAHVPRITDSGRRCEFLLGSSVPSTHELELIERGKRQMETAFPDRFTGGFSPPFDALPTWLPATWRSLSGRFLSCLCTNSGLDASIPVRRAGVDVWDWVAGRALNLDRLTHKLGLQLAVDGHAGIVLHPSCLRGRSDKLRLMKLLGCVVEAASTVSLADLALGKVDVARRYPPSAGLWTMFRGKPSTG